MLVAALISADAAFAAWRRRAAPGGLSLALFMTVMAGWASALALERVGANVPTGASWDRIHEAVVTGSPVLLFLFVLAFGRLDHRLRRCQRAVLWVIPALTLVMTATDARRSLLSASFLPGARSDSARILYSRGPWFWIGLIYAYLLVGASSAILIWAGCRFRGVCRRQALALLIGVPLPCAVSATCLLDLGPAAGCDLAPFSFALTGLTFLWSLHRLRLFDLLPVARDLLVEGMMDGVLVLDQENRVVDVNQAACEVLGAASSLIGRPVEEALARWPELVEHFIDVPETRTEICVGGDPPRHLDLCISPFCDHRCRLGGRLILWRDITERKQAQARIIEEQRALAIMEERERVGLELHDSVAQVLSYVSTQTQSTIKLIEAGDLGIAAARLARLSAVVADAGSDIRDFILGTRGADLSEQGFFDALEEHLERIRQMHDLTITVIHHPSLTDDVLSPMAQIQLLRIIQEALINVRKHARARHVRILFVPSGDAVQVVIADDGMGFNLSTDWRAAGHFGLEMMRERAANVGGTLEVSSVPGRGTHVIVTLPLRRDEDAHALHQQRVLLVDDHPLVLWGLKNLMETRGMDVVGTASDGREAVELARELRPELVLMDMKMPELSGPEATAKIKAELPDTEVVMLTVSASDDDLFEAVRSGASGYLLKSLEADEFFSLLSKMVRGEPPLAPGIAGRLLSGFAQPRKVFGLSRRQVEVLRLVAKGMTYKQIAAELYISERTVRYHMKRIKDCFNSTTRAEAVAYGVRVGLVPEDLEE
jgi:DNA-binding NarL/FixJ family response regulator/signal transduction histidine kinase